MHRHKPFRIICLALSSTGPVALSLTLYALTDQFMNFRRAMTLDVHVCSSIAQQLPRAG